MVAAGLLLLLELPDVTDEPDRPEELPELTADLGDEEELLAVLAFGAACVLETVLVETDGEVLFEVAGALFTAGLVELPDGAVAVALRVTFVSLPAVVLLTFLSVAVFSDLRTASVL